MSIIALEKAFAIADVRTGEKFVLVALANCQNKKTQLCCPSVKTLAAMTGLSPRQVQRHLDSLRGSGLISVTRQKRGRRWAHNVYKFHWPDHTTQVSSDKTDHTTFSDDQTTFPHASHDTHVALTGITEPEKRKGNPADNPQGGKSPSQEIITPGEEEEIGETKISKEIGEKRIGKKLAYEVYSVWESGMKNFTTAVPNLTAKEKKQLKDAAKAVSDLGGDPLRVISQTCIQWDLFKSYVKTSGAGFTVSANPDTGQLVKFARQAVERINEEDNHKAECEALRAQHRQAEAKAKAERERVAELASRREAFIRLRDEYDAHIAKKALPNFGMTEAWIHHELSMREALDAVEPELRRDALMAEQKRKAEAEAEAKRAEDARVASRDLLDVLDKYDV